MTARRKRVRAATPKRGGKRRRRLKILWLTWDRSHMAAQLFTPLRLAVEQRADVKVTTVVREKSGSSRDAKWNFRPLVDPAVANRHDVIFCDAAWAYFTEPWAAIQPPRAVLFEDLHGPQVAVCLDRWLRELHLAHVFVRYRAAARQQHGAALRDLDVTWLPHSIDPAVFTNGTPWEDRDIAVLQTGTITPTVYPFRLHAYRMLQALPGYLRVQRPPNMPGAWPTGKHYAAMLCGARIALHSTSVYHYPTAGCLEKPACGAALLTTWEPEMAALGFRAGVNCIAATKDNLRAPVDEWLADDDRLRTLAAAGHDLVHRRHTVKRRAGQLVTALRRIAKEG